MPSVAQKNKYKLNKVYANLYDMEWDCVDMADYDFAYDYFIQRRPVPNPGACSTVRNGNFLGRNFDWFYSDDVAFVVKTRAGNGSYATIGVCGSIPGLTVEDVESREFKSMYKMVPFMVVDGINSHGLACTTHVTSKDYGNATGTTPLIYKKHEICSTMLPRFILDRFADAKTALEYLRDYVSVFTSTSIINKGYELHFVVADAENTYALEFINNELTYFKINEFPYMTNFNLYNVERNLDGSVYTNETAHDGFNPKETNKITDYGSGLERYNFINANYPFTSNAIGMTNLMKALFYTNTYKRTTVPFWYSEYVGGDNTVESPIEDFEPIIEQYIAEYEERSRDNPITWETVHTSIMDFTNKTLTILFEEDQNKILLYDFSTRKEDKTSILNSTKKLLGIPEEYHHFDQDIIMHINSTFVILSQLGAGPASPFVIYDADAYWEDFFKDVKLVSTVKTYMGMKVRYMFDPPVGGVKDALEQAIAELEWRINAEYDNDLNAMQTRYDELADRVADLETFADDNDRRWYVLVGEDE